MNVCNASIKKSNRPAGAMVILFTFCQADQALPIKQSTAVRRRGEAGHPIGSKKNMLGEFTDDKCKFMEGAGTKARRQP